MGIGNLKENSRGFSGSVYHAYTVSVCLMSMITYDHLMTDKSEHVKISSSISEIQIANTDRNGKKPSTVIPEIWNYRVWSDWRSLGLCKKVFITSLALITYELCKDGYFQCQYLQTNNSIGISIQFEIQILTL